MYKTKKPTPTGFKINKSVQGESMEQKMERIINSKEPIKDGAPLIYTERKDGVNPSMNIRTDRWEVAVEASNKITKSYQARREEYLKDIVRDEPIQGTDEDLEK